MNVAGSTFGGPPRPVKAFIFPFIFLAEDRRRDIVRKTKNGLEAARARGRVGGRRPVVDDDKRAVILARRERGESIRTIAAGVKVSIGVVHKTLAGAQPEAQPNE